MESVYLIIVRIGSARPFQTTLYLELLLLLFFIRILLKLTDILCSTLFEFLSTEKKCTYHIKTAGGWPYPILFRLSQDTQRVLLIGQAHLTSTDWTKTLQYPTQENKLLMWNHCFQWKQMFETMENQVHAENTCNVKIMFNTIQKWNTSEHRLNSYL